MNRAHKAFATLASTALATAAMATVSPGVAQAAPTVCDRGHSWYTVSNKSYSLFVPKGGGELFSAPSSAPLRVTKNTTKTVSYSASYSASVGGNLSIEIPVRGFNIGAGIDSNADLAMDVKISYTGSVTQDITIPAGHTMMAYVGVQRTTSTVTKYSCPNGTAVKTDWRGTVTGPRMKATGWIDCKDTSLC